MTAPPDSVLFAGVDPAERFYFVHSYAAATTDPAVTVATYDDHGEPFIAAVESADGALAGTQFHPEKSGDVGATLLRNWVAGVADAVRRRKWR